MSFSCKEANQQMKMNIVILCTWLLYRWYHHHGYVEAAELRTKLKSKLRSSNFDTKQQPRLLSQDGGRHCGCMECDYDAWHTLAVDNVSSGEQHSCGSRVEYLMFGGMTEEEACIQVASTEFPNQCGKCNPIACTARPDPRCGCHKCVDVWNDVADSHSCGARITFLQTSKLLEDTLTEEEACIQVGRDE
jgi:hypothetical protein